MAKCEVNHFESNKIIWNVAARDNLEGYPGIVLPSFSHHYRPRCEDVVNAECIYWVTVFAVQVIICWSGETCELLYRVFRAYVFTPRQIKTLLNCRLVCNFFDKWNNWMIIIEVIFTEYAVFLLVLNVIISRLLLGILSQMLLTFMPSKAYFCPKMYLARFWLLISAVLSNFPLLRKSGFIRTEVLSVDVSNIKEKRKSGQNKARIKWFLSHEFRRFLGLHPIPGWGGLQPLKPPADFLSSRVMQLFWFPWSHICIDFIELAMCFFSQILSLGLGASLKLWWNYYYRSGTHWRGTLATYWCIAIYGDFFWAYCNFEKVLINVFICTAI